MKISIVTGTYNRLPYLERMIDSARNSVPKGIELEFVVVDGGSTDDTLDWLKAADDVVLIEHASLLGVQRAFCDGAKAATGDYVILANDDIRFLGDGIVCAFTYLENNPNCGAVAFADNRTGQGGHGNVYDVQYMPAHGRDKWVVYAQVGMYPRDIGDRAGWWGIDDPELPTITYGVDNYLSSRIWEMGYSVDAVEGCRVHDEIADDILRKRMNEGNSNGYFKRYPNGANIPTRRATRPEKRHLRILYLPIYEPGHTIQLTQKTGLRKALAKYGRGQWVYEFNYMAAGNCYEELITIFKTFQPDMILSQLHDIAYLRPDQIRLLRAYAPNAVWINWNGDYWLQSLVSEGMLHLLRQIDLQLVVNASVLEEYAGHAIAAAYWQIGYEDPQERAPKVPKHDVVWLASLYDDKRKAVAEALSEFDHHIYQPSDESVSTLYNFTNGKAIYRNAKIAIGTNEYPDAYGFVSNRLFQAMAAGNCLLLHQHIPGLYDLTGITEGKHYVEFQSIDEMVNKIEYYLENDDERRRMANRGTAFVRQHHSFDARIFQLLNKDTGLVHLTQRPPAVYFGVRYIGPRSTAFGVRIGNRNYKIQPGRVSAIQPEDKGYFERQPDLYDVVYPQEP